MQHPLASTTEGLLRLLVESVRDYAVFVLDPTGHVLTWNAGAERIKGYAAHEIIGRHFSTFYPPEDVAQGKPERELEIVLEEGRVEDEGWRLRKDGSRFWANVIITALRDERGELVGFAKVTRDLTDRRAAEEALRASEERFRMLVQSVQDYGIFMLDPTGHIASWNDGARRMNGYSEAEIIGRHFSIFYPARDLAWGKPEMELEAAKAEGRFEDEGWRLRKDGSPFWANVIITALRDDTGKLLGFSKVTRDLTERRKAEARAIQDARLIAEAEAANRAKSQFVAALSHELRTPLNAIGGYVDILTLGIRGPLSEAQREDLERIRRAQQHLLGIINDLLNYSRLEAGAVAYDITDVQLDPVLELVLEMVAMQAQAKGLELKWPEGSSGLAVLADSAKVEQILLNLLTNAIKFTEAGGRVEVSHVLSDGNVEIAVSDTGVGIPVGELETIFEPFVQVGRSLSSSHEGAGLGLAISRDLARAMGGNLTVQSALGAGSTFFLTLPLPGRGAAASTTG